MQRMIGGCSTRTSNELRPSEFVYCPHRKPKKTIPQPKVHLHEHERTSCLKSEARRRRRPAAERRTMPRGDTPASRRPSVCFVRACLANQCEVSCRRGEMRRRTAIEEAKSDETKDGCGVEDGRTTDGNRSNASCKVLRSHFSLCYFGLGPCTPPPFFLFYVLYSLQHLRFQHGVLRASEPIVHAYSAPRRKAPNE